MKHIPYIFALTMFLLVSCKVGPDYHKPDSHLPDKWTNENISAEQAIEQEWWHHFHDSALDEFIAKALKDNLDLKMAEARIREARAMRTATAGDLLPTVNMTASAERQGNRLAIGGGVPFDLTKPFNTFQAGFDASWELDLFGKNRRALESATAELKAAEAERDAAKVSLLAEVARTYVMIRGYEAQLAIVNDMVTTSEKTSAITKERYHSGVAPKLDVTQAEALLTHTQSEAPNLQNLITQNEYSMDVLLGEQPGYTHKKLSALPSSIPLGDTELVVAAPAQVIANRPDIHMAEYKLAAATAEQGVATAALFPDISLTGFFGLLNADANNLLRAGSKSWDIGGHAIWTIINYSKISAGIDAADARKQEALAQYQKAIITALSDVEGSLTAYEKEREQSDFLAKTAEEDSHAADIARMRYKAGLTSFLEVLDAERTYYNAKSQAIQANAVLSQDLIALYKSLGGGWKAPAPKATR